MVLKTLVMNSKILSCAMGVCSANGLSSTERSKLAKRGMGKFIDHDCKFMFKHGIAREYRT